MRTQGLTAFTNLYCRFAINFIESKNNNIALHINPRIKDKIVVRNTRIGGIWDTEERELNFNPFGPGLFFDVRAIYIKSSLIYTSTNLNSEAFCLPDVGYL